MSIRLRLTLLYSTILALTLIAFSVMVYTIQSQSTLNAQKQMLASRAQRFAEGRQLQLRGEGRPFPPDRNDAPTRTLTAPDTYMIQLRSLDGEVIEHPANLSEVALPFSDAGLQAVRNGEPWVEIASMENERWLVYSAPVVIQGQLTEVVQIARSLADRDQDLNTLRRNLLIGSTVATIAAFGVGWILSGLALRPINRITQTAQAIGAERDFSRRVQYTRPSDEIGQLATTFNAMLAELQAAYQQQQQFVADVSHELRTPLTTIRGNLELLCRQPSISTEDKADVLDDVVGESERLIRLVNDLLTLARAESGRLLRSEPIWVKPLIEDVCRQAMLLDPDRMITCTPLLDVAVVGDQDALKQVLLILMDNALKHSTGTITVTTARVDPKGFPNPSGLKVAISIRDTGPGIDPTVLPHVFERFYRGDEGRDRPGIGLGLPIAKSLVEAQNGTITVESQVGQGSVFIVTLPQAA
jgi:signal transduction histidine kinase